MLSDPPIRAHRPTPTSGRTCPRTAATTCGPCRRWTGAEHARLRRLVSPAFTPRRAAELPAADRGDRRRAAGRPAAQPRTGTVDLLAGFAGPLPMEVICEIVGSARRPTGRGGARWGAAVVAGPASGVRRGDPGHHRRRPGGGRRAGGPARRRRARTAPTPRTATGSTETELVTLVWHLVLAGQTPTNLVANAVDTLFAHPGPAAPRCAPTTADPGVDELTRWCGPQLLSLPRFAHARTSTSCGVPIGQG